MDLLERLNKDFPNLPQAREIFADTLNNYGVQLWGAGQPGAAEPYFRKALAVRTELAREFRHLPYHRARLAAASRHLGLLLKEIQQPDEAEQALRRAITLNRQLVAEFPGVPEYRRQLAAGTRELGTFYGPGRLAEAEQAFRDAQKEMDDLTQRYPAVPAYREDLAVLHHERGLILQAAGQLEAAEKAIRRGLELLDRLARDNPVEVGVYPPTQAVFQNNLGNVLAAEGKEREAEEAYRAALRFDPKLAPAYNGLALLLATRGRGRSPLPPEAIDLAKKAVQLAPRNGACWSTLAVVCRRAGDWDGGP